MPGCSERYGACSVVPLRTAVPVFVKYWFTGGTMGTTSVLACSGTVVVHRDQSVSCTDDTCPRDLPRGTWFSLHSSFVRCSIALGGDGCLYCEFGAPVRRWTGQLQPGSA